MSTKRKSTNRNSTKRPAPRTNRNSVIARWGKNVKRAASKAFRSIFAWLWKVSPIIYTTIYAAMLIIGSIFLGRTLLNEAAIANYEHENYWTFPENIVEYLDFGEREVAPYNLGNIRYQQGNYEDAISYYATALHEVGENTTQGRDCSIRINLALAILHTFDFDKLDLEDEQSVNDAITVLWTARNYLTENGCASEEMDTADGHSEDAEKLKHDIDEMLKKLSQNGGGGDNSQGDQDGGNGNGDEEDNSQNPPPKPDEQDGSSNEQQSQAEKEEAKRQEALEQQLNDQKQDLEGGVESYTDSDGHVYNYTQSDQVSGYGDAIPW